MDSPSDDSMKRVRRLVTKFAEKSGTKMHPIPEVTEDVIVGLAKNRDELGKPLCPCRFYPDKVEEVKHRTWICPCDDMQVYKYCHCLLFVTENGDPITEYLPDDHEGRQIYGLVKDPTPDQGRESRDKWEQREIDRKDRPS